MAVIGQADIRNPLRYLIRLITLPSDEKVRRVWNGRKKNHI